MSNGATAFEQAVAAVRGGTPSVKEARKLYDQLTDDERLALLDGDAPFWEGMAEMTGEGYNVRPISHGHIERMGIPGTQFVDGPRGCVSGRGTAFPVSMARGATWDLSLEERVGDAIGQEVRAQGGNFFGGVCINLPRHPAWGRAQETYSDEPYQLGEFGAALVRGTQNWVMACAKHYALNSMENARFTVDVEIDEADLHEIYLPHFKRVVDEGVMAIMSAYNSVNGEWAGQNEYLLTTVLRDYWGWDGITCSDFIFGLRDAATSLNAGLDLEEPFAQQRAAHLRSQMEEGQTDWAAVERAGLHLLDTQLRSYATRRTEDPAPDVMASPEHRELARTVAARSMVLLKNDPVDVTPVLPLPRDTSRIAVIGRLATAPNMGDLGSSAVRPPSNVTPLEGITAAFPDAEILLVEDDDPDAAAQAAAQADVAIVVAGFDMRDEGEFVGSDMMSAPEILALFPPAPENANTLIEATTSGEGEVALMTAGDEYGGDRASLALRPVDEQIILAVQAANPRTVVSIVASGAVLTENWRDNVPAILMMWYAGMEGGHALADVLTGAQNPSGHLPFSIPTSAEHLPNFDRAAKHIRYDHDHGQRLLDKLGVPAAYPHGFGLSYTQFSIREAQLADQRGDALTLEVEVENTGSVDGIHVVQVYGQASPEAGTFVVGFAPVEIPAGQSRSVRVPVSLTPLGRWDATRKAIIVPDGTIDLKVASHAHDPKAIALRLTMEH
ncbi:MAG: glycoside hydrolase family 3 C-terminal domain-containing protein [Actinomyces sp.]|jgi:beta-glucosidase|nr:glycoside hydrolase family 3 C-terminal domain-containing protein [Actinomyces sp.]MCI1691674.1 glycoside hydrolase family 3 C-terminal domain-containing protein [Actinomyces sp.]MCI1788000.1 glycoside hydrolase family 3 C-terminal domain-containing protein [Actinomyces sp.]MCI1830549.1 glycoside hydrolase family 3 C-terminal domain-containing protein [Actinomyces sp.]